jgi:hypothetical protein
MISRFEGLREIIIPWSTRLLKASLLWFCLLFRGILSRIVSL